MANYHSREDLEAIMAWLESINPDDWHRVADSWNWDYGEDVLRWIIEQPSCDKATALLVFWRGCPDYYWGLANDREGLIAHKVTQMDLYDMLVAIVARWKAGGFTRAELAYSPLADMKASPADVKRSALHLPLVITEGMVQNLIGRQLQMKEFYEKFPYLY